MNPGRTDFSIHIFLFQENQSGMVASHLTKMLEFHGRNRMELTLRNWDIPREVDRTFWNIGANTIHSCDRDWL